MVMILPTSGRAGNPQRIGQAGAAELLINPWARCSGWGGANSASIHGLEAMYLNVAGIAFTQKTELIFCRTSWLKGTDININSFGFTQKVGESGVFGLGMMSMDMGDIQITTTDLPEGGIGTYSPSFMNLGLSYAKVFSNSIYGGITMKLISESISDVSAMGATFDAGIQYVTGIGKDKAGKKKTDNLKFGISLKNVGPPMKFTGDGLSFRATVPATGNILTVEQRSDKFELPSLVNIGGTYEMKVRENHHINVAGNFCSNSFSKDQYSIGLEYGYKTYFMLRGGFTYEQDILDANLRTTALTGPSAGFTVEIPIGKGKSFGLDYSYRATNPFQGCHSMGARINL